MNGYPQTKALLLNEIKTTRYTRARGHAGKVRRGVPQNRRSDQDGRLGRSQDGRAAPRAQLAVR